MHHIIIVVMVINVTKRKIITVLTIILLIVNIFVAALIFLDIQVINAPKTEVFIDIVEVNSEEVILDAKLKMHNSNSFDIEIKDFTVTSLNYENEEIGKLKIKGGNIPAHETKAFSEREKVIFKESENYAIIKNRITGRIGVTFIGFIKKTIPIDVTVFTSVEKIFENLQIPDVSVKAYLNDLSDKGIHFTAEVSVNNPTSIVYNVNDLFLDFITEEETSVGNITVDGGSVEPQKSRVFYSNGTIHYDALNVGSLTLKLNGIAGAKVAGLNKNISFSTEASLIIPDIKEFIFKGEELDFRIPVQFKLTLKGILSNVGFSFYNPSNVSLIGDNLKCLIYRVDGEKQTLLGQETMNPCKIQPGERICVKTQIIIPYTKYLFSGLFRFIPDWIVLRIEGDFHIAGTNQAFPLALNAYVDPNVIKQKEFH
jgi:hypothetical protein